MPTQAAASPFLSDAVTGAFAIVLALLSAYVGLDSAKRAGTRSTAHTVAWTLAAALALGTGAWALHVINMLSLERDFSLGYQPFILLAAWLLGVAVSLPGWFLAFARPAGVARLALSAALLSLGMLLVQGLSLLSPGFTPGLAWNWGGVALAAAGTLVACGLALAAMLAGREERPWPWIRQPVAVLLLSLALWWSEWQISASAGLPLQHGATYADMLSIRSLSLLASFGTLILLLMTMITSMTEARMQASLQQAEGSLERQTHTDQLTGLPNRLFIEERLLNSAARADLARERLALLFIDLDGFKPINESFGHRFGDLLLQETALRIKEEAGSNAVVARWAADEFLVLIEEDQDKDAVAACARRLLDRLKTPFQLEGRDVPVAASIGVAVYPADGAQSTLITHADAAARAAKSAGGDTYCFFEPHMMRDAREQMELLHDLRNALDQGQLELYYQPKVHAPSGQITGAEALLRWNHPVRGLISPAVFIPIAERFGLIGTIGNWVIEEACRQIRQWRDGGMRMRVAINLSAHQLRQNDLCDRIAAALREQDINPKLLTCEITESVAMEDTESTSAIFRKLAEVGVHISIDDFGTGYSSLSYLRQLPAEELKIDRGFIIDLETSNDARAVVDAVVKLGLALGLKVVAEGVETEAQYHILRQLGCDELQGFLFAKPMAAKMLFLWAVMDSGGPTNLDFRPSLFGDTMMHPLDEKPVKP
jgi:diguanylate cyclase (GGDEF)-like protein